MTVAVCFHCGELKFGAFCPCNECGQTPETDDDLVLSLAMTDHFFDRSTLEGMGRQVKRGKPPRLDDQTRSMLLAQVREFRQQLGGQEPPPSNSTGHASAEVRPGRRSWWKFWGGDKRRHND